MKFYQKFELVALRHPELLFGNAGPTTKCSW